MAKAIKCKICDEGQLVRRRKHRLSGPAVLVGYILVIPSVIGIAIGVLLMLLGGVSSVSSANVDNLRRELRSANIPINIVDKIAAGTDLTRAEKRSLSAQQIRVIDDAIAKHNTTILAAGIAPPLGLGIAISSLVGGTLGYLLIMKKHVLRCAYCSAEFAAK
ncbi:MAG: hypothetical protein KF866_07525 [Phycisphaeraceae bacterium]|nr:hypothetical protein [Phycisphaeraceae bacterium]MCW5753730.1 hypothetical protein [Phycisphaeraceae bacterium]